MRVLLLFLLLMALGLLAWQRGVRVPDRLNPWAPIDLRQPIDWLTGFKLRRLAAHPQQCRRALAQAGVRFTPVPDRVTGRKCGWHDAVRLRAIARARLSRSALLSCPLAASLALFDLQVLQPGARRLLGSYVVEIHHFGSYACRNIDHRAAAPRSLHATAQALDVAGFVLADGRRITIAADWSDADARGRFLHALHDGACRVFGVVLGPDYNALHQDHFHVQARGFGFCH